MANSTSQLRTKDVLDLRSMICSSTKILVTKARETIYGQYIEALEGNNRKRQKAPWRGNELICGDPSSLCNLHLCALGTYHLVLFDFPLLLQAGPGKRLLSFV
jgi:hypothetical protein